MKITGLTAAQVEESRARYGSNRLTVVEQDPLWKKILEGFKDPMIMILMVALAVQLVLYTMGQAEWYEPFGVFVAIVIANGVAAVSENSQEGKAAELREEETAKERTKVIRDGKLQEICVTDVVTGDIVYLQSGDRIPADGIVCQGAVKIDQSVLNGETEEIEKIVCPEGVTYDVNDLLNQYYIYRGTVVCDKEAYMEAKVVGDGTFFGKLSLEAQEEQRQTPLQVKLAKLAGQISTFGYIGAIAIVVGILAKTFITGATPDDMYEWIRLIMDAITVAVTIIVCAVPEGLPMLTSILLSFQSIRMEKDNVLVKKINGLETSGSLSLLFSDKTGTITQGILSVVGSATGDGKEISDVNASSASYKQEILNGIGLNNSSQYSDGNIIGGNFTDRALMKYMIDLNMADKIDHSLVVEPSTFNSKNKYATVVLKGGLSYVKGAPEILLPRIKSYMDTNGVIHTLDDVTPLDNYMNEQANRAMRLLAVTKVAENGEDLILICVLSIRDNVRPEAVAAIKEVQNAGIQVVMVTGDRKETAVAIAKEAALLTADDQVVLTSAELNAKSDEEIKSIIPKLRVVARALPTDKSRLVRLAQELDYVVGMTGDGVNDSPALRKADVGFAMGSGTEVAKESGDIVILDDNFSSIEKAILYGRTMFKSIRKFLIFQLTVNVAAVVICFLAPMFGENVVLTVIQLLLINLAMDTLAAIAFGSEPALKEYMQELPVPRRESIITSSMMTQLLISAAYITVACLSIIFVEPVRSIFGNVDVTYLKSALFATFMMAITFNGFNARTSHLNPFEHMGRNTNFLLVMLSIFLMQFVFVELGGEVLSVEPLSAQAWITCAVIAFMVIPLDVIRKLIFK